MKELGGVGETTISHMNGTLEFYHIFLNSIGTHTDGPSTITVVFQIFVQQLRLAKRTFMALANIYLRICSQIASSLKEVSCPEYVSYHDCDLSGYTCNWFHDNNSTSTDRYNTETMARHLSCCFVIF